MGNCIYCGERAGFLSRSHKECRQRHKAAIANIPEYFAQAMEAPIDVSRFKQLAQDMARASFIQDREFRQLAVRGLTKAIVRALDDHVITTAESERIDALGGAFGLTANDLPQNIQHRFVKAHILRDIDDGRVPNRISIEGGLTPNLERGESVVWAFNTSKYFTTRSRTQYESVSHGVSVRLMKGVYYRAGASKGHAVRTNYMSEEGSGCLLITNRNVLFVGPGKGVKLPFRKILSVQLYSDGIEVLRDGTNAKPAVFKIDDPPFAANLIARLSQI
jgi:hypothetical protein